VVLALSAWRVAGVGKATVVQLQHRAAAPRNCSATSAYGSASAHRFLLLPLQSSLAELAGHLNHLDPRRPGTLGNPGLGGGAAELQRLRMEMDQLLRSNLMTGLDEVREQLANNIKIQSQLAKACADLEEWRR
jgi:hypothetical protein